MTLSANERGAVMALLDEAMADAARRNAGVDCGVTTVDIHVTFLGAADGRIRASARVCGGGRSVCFCEGKATDAAGRMVATAMATLRFGEPARPTA